MTITPTAGPAAMLDLLAAAPAGATGQVGAGAAGAGFGALLAALVGGVTPVLTGGPALPGEAALGASTEDAEAQPRPTGATVPTASGGTAGDEPAGPAEEPAPADALLGPALSAALVAQAQLGAVPVPVTPHPVAGTTGDAGPAGTEVTAVPVEAGADGAPVLTAGATGTDTATDQATDQATPGTGEQAGPVGATAPGERRAEADARGVEVPPTHAPETTGAHAAQVALAAHAAQPAQTAARSRAAEALESARAATGTEATAGTAGVAGEVRTESAPAQRAEVVTRQVFPEVVRLASNGNGTHRVALRLDPGTLGEVRVVLTVRDGEVSVRIAAGSEARDLLAEAAPELRALLEQVRGGEARVSVADLLTGATAASYDGRSALEDHSSAAGRHDQPGADRSGERDGDRPGQQPHQPGPDRRGLEQRTETVPQPGAARSGQRPTRLDLSI